MIGLVLSVSVACGDNPAGPEGGATPVPVASVSLVRDTATVPVGGTVQLAVILRDAQGTEISGRAIAWTSTALATATVSNTGLVTAAGLGQSKIVATVEGVSDTATVRVPPSPAVVTLQPGSATTVTIGSAGGTIQTTDANGVQYTLEIPELALMAPVAITMTPLATATGLPLAGGFVAGADFKPSGLQFAQPATLTIVTSAAPGAGQSVVGLSYEGAGESLTLTGAKRESNTLTIGVSHFSGVMAGFGTTQDVDALYVSTVLEAQPSTSDGAISLLIVHATNTPRDGALELNIMEGWFDVVILPELSQASTDLQLLQAVGAYEGWRRYWPEFLNLYLNIPGGEGAPSLVTRRTLWEQAFVAKVKLAIAANKQLCAAPGLASSRVTALNNALFWHRIARYVYFVDTPENALDLAALRADLCVTAMSQNLVLPDPLVEGRTDNLDVTFALRFNDGVVVPANFLVQTTGQGANLNFPDATAAAPAGFYTGLVTPTGETVTLDLAACYAGGGVAQLIADEICQSVQVVRNVETTPPPPPPPPPSSCGGTITSPSPISTQEQLTPIVNAEEISGDLVISFATMPELVLPCLKRVTGAVVIGSSGVLGKIEFPALEDVGNFVSIGNNLVLTTVRLPLLKSVGATSALGGGLGVFRNDALVTLEVGPAVIRRVSGTTGGGMQLLQPLPALTNLGLLSSGISADTLFFSLPGPGQNGFTEAVVRDFGNRASFAAVCEILATQARKCE